ncbi:glycosyltransferase [Mesorhizobium sp.]|uniref:glycosyltransferase n=1 Tax=Mesorhizobium sp. TaxID=1871066 RepID=UPI000FE5270F|nr:glycosyltransferase [Mesorhizobium sp.]RWP65914.1 MAG: glycosyltransferase [Mesorhizobium sp.]
MESYTSERKVLHVIATMGRGGTELTALRLARKMLTAHSVHCVFVALRDGDLSLKTEFELLSDASPKSLHADRRKLTSFTRLFVIIRSQRPSVIIFHSFDLQTALFIFFARMLGVKRIVTKIGNPAPLRGGRVGTLIFTKLPIALARFAGANVVASSRWSLSTYQSVLALPATVIHNGIDIQSIRHRAAAARVARPVTGKVIIGMVARLDKIKDHHSLIRAFALVAPGNEVELRIIGDGPLFSELVELAHQLGVEKSVRFLGGRSDIAEQLGEMDLFIFSTTKAEGFGIALIEALAADLPIIASDVPACREVLQAGRFGRLIDTTDVALFASLMKERIASLPTNSTPAVSAIEEYYSEDGMAQKYIALFQS